MSVAELERRIERQFGLSVDPKTLYRLTHADPVQRADLEIAGAAATVLGVRLDDIFEVQVTADAEFDEDGPFVLTSEESRRMAELLDLQGRAGLSQVERGELDNLALKYGRDLHERRLRQIAGKRGVTVEQARRDVARDLDETLAWWVQFDADQESRRSLASTTRSRRQRRSD
jgi:malonyl CoA-acyl carrier protein transacylase